MEYCLEKKDNQKKRYDVHKKIKHKNGFKLLIIVEASPRTRMIRFQVITAFFMAPVIEFFCVHVARPMVKEE